jgi:hypothetical protein
MRQTKEKIAPLPSVWATIAAGFDVTARHFWLVLIPVLLDSFLWLGPRLSLRLLVERMASFLQQESAVATGLNIDLLLDIAPRTNLFTTLSVPFIGVPALMAGIAPEKTPLPPMLIELSSVALLFLLFVLLSVLGLALTAVYMTLTASVVREMPVRQALGKLFANWLKLMGLIIALIFFAMIVYVPVVFAGFLAALINQALASVILLAGPVIVLWLAVYLVFTPHGIFVNGRPLWRAMIESSQILRYFLLSAVMLLLVILLIGRGVDWLLLLADDGSWLTWISIWGHAFVSTALLVATFIFYRDRYNVLYDAKRPLVPEAGSIHQ